MHFQLAVKYIPALSFAIKLVVLSVFLKYSYTAYNTSQLWFVWAVKKELKEKKLYVAEMRMLRWICGVNKLGRIRNERIRGTTKVGEISKKVQESRLKWYWHTLRREEECVGKRVILW